MNRSLTARIMDLLQRRQMKGALAKAALGLSCIAIFLITYMLVAPVLTQEWEATCGLEEHTHTDACYGEVSGEIVCGMEAHTHSDECLDEDGNLSCGLEEHIHTEACCQAVEETGHKHTDACYSVVPVETEETGHKHTDACYTLVPAETEESGHTHTDACYEEVRGELACGLEEHSHSDGCLDEEGNQICELSEHTHEDSCYAYEKELICGLEETEEQEPEMIPTLTCGLEETEEQPPETDTVLTCGLEETEVQEPEKVRVLICGLAEHTHTDQCYQKAEESAPKYTCGFLTEHTHGEDCYFENGELKCTIPEHVHEESCLEESGKSDQRGETDWSGFPEELPEGYVEGEVWSDAGMFAMTNEEDDGEGTGEAGINAVVYVPEDAFEEAIMFVPQLLLEDDEAYIAAVEALAQAGAEYEGVTAMDLSFLGLESEAILEPKTENGPVYVRLTMPAEGLPEDAELTLWHHTEDGAEKVENCSYKYADGTLTVDFMTYSFSQYSIIKGTSTKGAAVRWGQAVESDIKPRDDTDGVYTWDVSSSAHRILQIPVMINVENVSKISLPMYLTGDFVRDGEAPPELNVKGFQENYPGWEINTSEGNDNTTVTIKPSEEHGTIKIYYTFDCWNIVSDRPFTIDCTIMKGTKGKTATEETTYQLTGKIKTGHGVEMVEYANAWGDSEYAYDGFGGVDKKSAYIKQWNAVYRDYFDLEEQGFNSSKANYVYDIAAFVVKPTGQQPYSISGTITPRQSGEVMGGVYMMDSSMQTGRVNLCLKSKDTGSGFELSQNTFTINSDKLRVEERNAVVSGSLSDPTDSKTYTLYFLVKYPKDSLKPDEADKVKLEAELSLTHTGVDSDKKSATTATTCLYEGPKEYNDRIYWASYVSDNVTSGTGLSNLREGKPATLDFRADFFCLNEARSNRAEADTYQMQAIIDLSFLTNTNSTNITWLKEGEYQFTGFSFSVIDAPGNWSQNEHGTPNVGWTPDKFNSGMASGCQPIQVYGSKSLTENSWELLDTVQAADVWAIDQNRDINESMHAIEPGKGIVRLKVVYNSQHTTALRVGYRMELLPEVLKGYNTENLSTLKMTSWLNYVAYKGTEATAENKDLGEGFYRTTVIDDTMSLAREYDEAHPYPGYENLRLQSGENDPYEVDGYSMRNFAKAELGSGKDVAGMVVTQTLYNSDGTVVGSAEKNDSLQTDKSYSLKTDVVNVSEIVYNISGVITDGSTSFKELTERRNNAENGSPYKSTTLRYYVLVPEGLELNMSPKDNYGSGDDFWYISPYSTFYNSNSSKVVNFANGWGDTVATVSAVNVPTLPVERWTNMRSVVVWGEDGCATYANTLPVGKSQLIIFERTIDEKIAGTLGNNDGQYNPWDQNKPYFWGRGLSFSVVPTGGTGALPEGGYDVKFWCEFLDADGKAMSMDGFDTDLPDAFSTPIKDAVAVDESKLLYINSTFHNYAGSAVSSATLGVRNTEESSNNNTGDEFGESALVDPHESYRYKLEYKVAGGSASDVVLWCNVEDQAFNRDGKSPEWRGIIQSVDLNGTGAEVYVRTGDTFDIGQYLNSANKSLLTAEGSGWTKVENPAIYEDWANVKSIAFSFEGKTFSSSNQTATVYIDMNAPEDDPLYIGDNPKEVGKTEYKTYNEYIFSDNHTSDSADKKDGEGRVRVNYTEVTITVTPVSYVLPSTGGAGTTITYTTGLGLILGAAYLMYQNLRRGRETGVPEAAPEDKRGGSRLR